MTSKSNKAKQIYACSVCLRDWLRLYGNDYRPSHVINLSCERLSANFGELSHDEGAMSTLLSYRKAFTGPVFLYTLSAHIDHFLPWLNPSNAREGGRILSG